MSASTDYWVWNKHAFVRLSFWFVYGVLTGHKYSKQPERVQCYVSLVRVLFYMALLVLSARWNIKTLINWPWPIHDWPTSQFGSKSGFEISGFDHTPPTHKLHPEALYHNWIQFQIQCSWTRIWIQEKMDGFGFGWIWIQGAWIWVFIWDALIWTSLIETY